MEESGGWGRDGHSPARCGDHKESELGSNPAPAPWNPADPESWGKVVRSTEDAWMLRLRMNPEGFRGREDQEYFPETPLSSRGQCSACQISSRAVNAAALSDSRNQLMVLPSPALGMGSPRRTQGG